MIKMPIGSQFSFLKKFIPRLVQRWGLTVCNFKISPEVNQVI